METLFNNLTSFDLSFQCMDATTFKKKEFEKQTNDIAWKMGL